MGQIIDIFKSIYADGPSLSPSEPSKPRIRQELAPTLEAAINGAAAGAVRMETWAALAAVAGTRAGQPAEVPNTATGTHTDPVAGGTVPNAGSYRWSVSPAGWRRVGDYVDATGKADQSAVDALTTTVGGKANQSAVDSLATVVGGKANQTTVDALSTTVGGKANQSAVDSLVTTVGGKLTNAISSLRLFGRRSAGSGSAEEVAAVRGLSIDVTGVGLADMAAGTFKGRVAGAGTGTPTDMTKPQVKTGLDLQAFETVDGSRGVVLSHPGLTPADVGAPVVNDPDWLEVVTDSYGKTLSGTRREGGFFDAYKARGYATVSHIIVFSQSLGLGFESVPPISTGVNAFAGKIFGRGFATWLFGDNPATPGSRSDAEFDLQAMTDFVSPYLTGETIGNGLVAGLKCRIGGFFGVHDYTNTAPYFVLSNSCDGSRFLTEISQENSSIDPLNAGARGSGGYYETAIDDAWRVKGWAVDRGLDYGVPAIIFMQGEQDAGYRRLYAFEASPYDYASMVAGYSGKLMDLADSINADLSFITGRSARIPFLTYQTSDTLIGESQVRASEDGEDIYMVSPTYCMPSAVNSVIGSGGSHTHGSPIHLAADAERWMGEQFAKVLHAIKSGTNWKPLKRVAARKIDNTTIEIELDGVRGALKVDTTFLAKAIGWGFEVRSGAPDDRFSGTDTVIYPSSIAIVGPSTIRLGLPSSIATGTWYLRYGGVFGSDISATVASVRNGPTVDGVATKELVLSADVYEALAPLWREGAFNSIRGSVQMPVRAVYDEGGFTVLQGEASEITGGTHTAGAITFGRWTGYGNIRDSDDELSAYSWSNQAYHHRTGRYPLWNWLTMFDNLRIV